MTEPTRVLLVDDFASWRNATRSILQDYPQLQVVGEAVDGAGAIELARELKPELILLDISCSQPNGIETAKQIRQVAPGAKIVFVSMNTNPEIVRAAWSAGASGYVLKINAATELWSGIEAVLQGKQFASSGLHLNKD